jgi:hypothetical protein
MGTLCVVNAPLLTKYGKALKNDAQALNARRTKTTAVGESQFVTDGLTTLIFWLTWAKDQPGFALSALTTKRVIALKIAFGPPEKNKPKIDETLDLLRPLEKHCLLRNGVKKQVCRITRFILDCEQEKHQNKPCKLSLPPTSISAASGSMVYSCGLAASALFKA